MATIKNRSEIIFLYDVKDNNPNGDPLNENKPRIDEETKLNYVTDVRLKRTIRDFLAKVYKNQEPNKIFMLAERNKDGTLVSMTKQSEKYENAGQLKQNCLDIRLFGGTIAVKTDDSNAITGPAQFRIGRSMHRVVCIEDQITRTVPNEEGKKQGTFGFDQRLYYSLINFYGVINENTAKSTGLTDKDVQKLLQGIWWGTKELNTRTRIGHNPRLLLKIDYKPGFYIGDLDSKLKLQTDLQDEQLRSTDDFVINTSQLNNVLSKHKDKIENIYFAISDDLKLSEEIKVENINKIDLLKEEWFNVLTMV